MRSIRDPDPSSAGCAGQEELALVRAQGVAGAQGVAQAQGVARARGVTQAPCAAQAPGATQAPGVAQAPGAALALRNDELEMVIATARLGFCRIDGATRSLHSNSQFKAEFGWAPDADIEWRELLERVSAEHRAALSDAVREGLRNARDLDLTVKATWPDGT